MKRNNPGGYVRTVISRLVDDYNHPAQWFSIMATHWNYLGNFLKMLIKNKNITLTYILVLGFLPQSFDLNSLACNINIVIFQTSQSFDSFMQPKLRTTEDGFLHVKTPDLYPRINNRISGNGMKNLSWKYSFSVVYKDWSVWIQFW